MGEEEKAPERAPRMRLSAERRDRFLEVLGQTGNRRFAAEAIGVDPRLMDQRRRFDKVLDRQWEAALDQAHRRLSGADGPFDCIGGRELNVIKKGRGGRLMIVASGPKRWCKAVEDRFFATLRMCGNVAASARAVGFGESCVWQRRAKWPGFARRMEEVLEEAEMRIEYRLAAMGSELAAAGAGTGTVTFPHGDDKFDDAVRKSDCPLPFDTDLALRFLRWREQKRHGFGPRGRRRKGPPDRTFDEAVQSILTKVEAIESHDNRRKLEEGWSQDEEGRMIPPGWIRAEGRREEG